MSARDWQPGEPEVEAAARALYEEERNESMGFDAWPEYDDPENVGRHIYEGHARAALIAAHAVTADLLPVPQAVEGAIDGEVEDAITDEIHNRLHGFARTAEERFLGATYVEDLSPTHGGLDETVEVIQPGRSEAEVKAEALREFADTRGVHVGDEDDEWWRGYRQAQRECLHAAAAAADRIGGE